MTLLAPPLVQRPLSEHRARQLPVKGAIVHAMGEHVSWEGQLLYAPDVLKAQKLSVHACITPDGKVLACVPVDRIAYHAGQSRFGAEDNLNKTFLGCEFLVAGDHDYTSFLERIADPDAYAEAQYQAGGWLYASWQTAFGFPDDRIVGHSQVSGDDVRGPGKGKRDPGKGFDWDRFRHWIGQWREQMAPLAPTA